MASPNAVSPIEELSTRYVHALKRFAFPRGYSAWDTRTAQGSKLAFDVQAALRSIQFVEQFVSHSKGELAGRPLILEDWQRAIFANLFGWKRADGTRRYRRTYIEIPRKNGKSTLSAGIALLGLYIDAEPGAEVYSCAADKEQAAIVFEIAKQAVLRSEPLARRSTLYKSAIEVRDPHTGIPTAFYRVLSSEAYSKHGLNPSLVVMDELHAQPNRELWDVMRTGMGARRQPLLCAITTAGYDRQSICYEQRKLSEQIAAGIIEDPSYLPIVYAADAEDDWEAPEIWRKANPNLGVSVSEEYIADEVRQAKNVPATLNTFLQLHLNVWTTQRTRAIDPNAWDACYLPPEEWPDLKKVDCFGAADLAHARDLTALAWLWELDEALYVRAHFWVPHDIALEIEKTHNVPYSTWARDGWITLTEGDVTDYGHLRREVRESIKRHRIKGFGCDPYNATHLLVLLQDEDGLKCVEKYGQSTANLNEPLKDLLEVRLPKRQLVHDGNPVLAWCASNLEIKKDAGERWRPVKPQDSPVAKIDGMTSLVMANGMRIAAGRKNSVYTKRGPIVLG